MSSKLSERAIEEKHHGKNICEIILMYLVSFDYDKNW